MTKKTTKKSTQNNEVCPHCGKVHPPRKNLGIKCTKEELDSLKLIQNKIACANQAARVDAIPLGVPKEQAEAFIAGAIHARAEALWLQQMWWEEVTAKYQLPPRTYIDFTTGEFYQQE